MTQRLLQIGAELHRGRMRVRIVALQEVEHPSPRLALPASVQVGGKHRSTHVRFRLTSGHVPLPPRKRPYHRIMEEVFCIPTVPRQKIPIRHQRAATPPDQILKGLRPTRHGPLPSSRRFNHPPLPTNTHHTQETLGEVADCEVHHKDHPPQGDHDDGPLVPVWGSGGRPQNRLACGDRHSPERGPPLKLKPVVGGVVVRIDERFGLPGIVGARGNGRAFSRNHHGVRVHRHRGLGL